MLLRVREEERVRESAVPPKVTIVNTESEPNDVNIRKDGTDCSGNPKPLWNTGAVETSPDAQCCHGV